MAKPRNISKRIRGAKPKGHISNIFGMLKRKSAKRLSLKEMKEIVETHASKGMD